jgi:hypothetical protein
MSAKTARLLSAKIARDSYDYLINTLNDFKSFKLNFFWQVCGGAGVQAAALRGRPGYNRNAGCGRGA